MLKSDTTPEMFPDQYAAQRGIYIGRLDMARGVIRHMENEIRQVQAMLDRLPTYGAEND